MVRDGGSRPPQRGVTRRLLVSGSLVFVAVVLRAVLIRAGGPTGVAAEWLPIAVVAATLGWNALRIARNVPGLWRRPLPRVARVRNTPARAVALNGMLTGMAVLLSLVGSRLPGLGWLVYWLGGLPIMLAVSLDRRWGILAYLAATFVIAETFAPRRGLVFALFTGLLGVVSGVAAASGRSWSATGLLCAAAQVPALAVLVAAVPGFQVFWFRPNPRAQDGLLYLVLAAGLLGVSWTMTAMLLYTRIVRALRQQLAFS
ncbi:MAG TPA: hypothetical protein VKZ50_19160 [bacterium]|nr:hypothetical protein [bacterium]